MTRLTKIEKNEMLEDAKCKKRMMAFRKVKNCVRKMSFEEYACWLDHVRALVPKKYSNRKKRFVEYKNVKI